METINCPECGEAMPYIKEQVNFCPSCNTKFNEDELGECERCGEVDLLSDESLCNYCQHMWEKD